MAIAVDQVQSPLFSQFAASPSSRPARGGRVPAVAQGNRFSGPRAVGYIGRDGNTSGNTAVADRAPGTTGGATGGAPFDPSIGPGDPGVGGAEGGPYASDTGLEVQGVGPNGGGGLSFGLTAEGVGKGLGSLAGGLIGGPLGSAVGGFLGGKAGSAFGGSAAPTGVVTGDRGTLNGEAEGWGGTGTQGTGHVGADAPEAGSDGLGGGFAPGQGAGDIGGSDGYGGGFGPDGGVGGTGQGDGFGVGGAVGGNAGEGEGWGGGADAGGGDPGAGGGGDGGGGCWITEAVMSSGGQDNGPELETLRMFRDQILASTPEGQALIGEYDAIAPIVVENIMQREDALDIFQNIDAQFIVPAVDAVKRGDYQGALQIYAQMIAKVTPYAVEASGSAMPGGADNEAMLEDFGSHAASMGYDHESTQTAVGADPMLDNDPNGYDGGPGTYGGTGGGSMDSGYGPPAGNPMMQQFATQRPRF